MQRIFLISAFALIVSIAGAYAFLTITERSKDDGLLTTITVGTNPGIFPLNTLVYIGTQEGIFARHGIRVESESIGANVSVPGLLSGSLDFSPMQKEAATASLQGAAIQGVLPLTSTQFLYLVGKPGMTMDAIKTIGITARLSLPHYLALEAMERHGITAEFVESGGNSAALRALLADGRVDAVVVGLPAPHQFTQDGYEILDRFEDVRLPTFLSASKEYVATHSTEITAFAEALAETRTFVANNKEKTTQYLATLLGLDESIGADTLNEIYRTTAAIVADVTPDPRGMDTLIQIGKAGAFTTITDITAQTVTQEDRDTVFSFIAL